MNWRLLRCAVLAVSFALVLVGSACGGGDAKAGPGREIKLVMGDNFFEPNAVTVKAEETVTFVLPNEGKLPHNMHIAALNGSYRTPWGSVPAISNPGTTGKLTWEVPSETGRYRFRCELHETQMVGTITVE